MDEITYNKKTKNLNMKNLRLSSMAMADSKYSSLTAWNLNPDSYKTTIVKSDESDSGSSGAQSGEKEQSADDALITCKPEDADNEGRKSPTADETKRTYAEAAGSSPTSADRACR